MLQVLRLRGGGVNALGRHAVAALLNSASPDVNYCPKNIETIIWAFSMAWDGPWAIEGTKNVFENFNELGCPLD